MGGGGAREEGGGGEQGGTPLYHSARLIGGKNDKLIKFLTLLLWCPTQT